MINQGLNEMMATHTWQENERTIAAAALRRQAKAARHAEGASDRAVAVRMPCGSAIASVAGAWRARSRGLVAVVVRRAPA